jgi:hypothetical protein
MRLRERKAHLKTKTMKRIDQLKRSIVLYTNRVNMNKEKLLNAGSLRVKNNARLSVKKYERKIILTAKDIQAYYDNKKKTLSTEDVNKVKKVIGDFYGINIDEENKSVATIGLNGKARKILCHLLAVYFEDIKHGIIGKAIGRKASTVSYGFNVCQVLREEDIYFRKEINNISILVANVLGVEVKNPINRRILKATEEQEKVIVRPSKEMPTIKNNWLKPLRKNNLENKEMIKPVYF